MSTFEKFLNFFITELLYYNPCHSVLIIRNNWVSLLFICSPNAKADAYFQ